MPLHNDGDLVRAYGFVAIRFVEVEDCIDHSLRQAETLLQNSGGKPLDRVLRLRFSDRVEALNKVFEWAKTNGPTFISKESDLKRAEQALSACVKVAKQRNETLHSPIVADMRTGDVIRSPRKGDPYQIEADKVYDLANDIEGVTSAVRHLQFVLRSILGCSRL